VSRTAPLRDTARTALRLALSRPAWLGEGRLVCVDGPAGSGKSTLAAEIEQVAGGLTVTTVHTDDVLVGWDGLHELGPRLRRDIVDPLASGQAAGYRRYDWARKALAEHVPVPPVDLLVLEGVGSAHLGYAGLVAALVWVEAPPAVRRARGLARDGEELMPFWDTFVGDEDRLHAAERTRERADLLVDGLTGAVVTPRQEGRPADGQAGVGPSSSRA
jgi:uridine kinase